VFSIGVPACRSTTCASTRWTGTYEAPRTPGGFFDPVSKALASLAGPCAEEFYTDVDLARQPKSRTDLKMAREAVARLGSPDLAWLIPRARTLVRQEWPRIQTLAAALLQRRRLDYGDVLGLIQ
jgi:hypothetical protein